MRWHEKKKTIPKNIFNTSSPSLGLLKVLNENHLTNNNNNTNEWNVRRLLRLSNCHPNILHTCRASESWIGMSVIPIRYRGWNWFSTAIHSEYPNTNITPIRCCFGFVSKRLRKAWEYYSNWKVYSLIRFQ